MMAWSAPAAAQWTAGPLNGCAAMQGTELNLTPTDSLENAGSVWNKKKADFTQDFELEFDVKAEQPAEVEAEPEVPAPAAIASGKKPPAKKKTDPEKSDDSSAAPAKGAEVVSLDAFRKK